MNVARKNPYLTLRMFYINNLSHKVYFHYPEVI